MVRFVSKDLKYVGHETKTLVGLNKNYTIISFVDQQPKRQIAIYDWSGKESAALTFKTLPNESGNGIRWYISGYVKTKGNVNYLVLVHFGIIKDDKIHNPYTNELGLASVSDTIRNVGK